MPTGWWSELPKKLPLKIWLDTGTLEPGWERARELRDQLVAKGWRLNHDLQYTEVEGGDHSERAWAARFEAVLRFLYPRLRSEMKGPPLNAVPCRNVIVRRVGKRNLACSPVRQAPFLLFGSAKFPSLRNFA